MLSSRAWSRSRSFFLRLLPIGGAGGLFATRVKPSDLPNALSRSSENGTHDSWTHSRQRTLRRACSIVPSPARKQRFDRIPRPSPFASGNSSTGRTGLISPLPLDVLAYPNSS